MTTTLADDLRQIADNLDRAASISAQYCASKHHTDLIREAAARLEELEGDLRRTRRVNRMFRDHCRDAHAHLIDEAEDNDNVARGVGHLDYLLERIKGDDSALEAAPGGATP